MNTINKKYTNSTILVYNNQGQIVALKRFLPKGTKRYYEYKGYRAKTNGLNLNLNITEVNSK
ncbi:MAG TPA: hypothetical protein PLC61_07020 [Chitinophagales bacterium]|nr:hypothetical protein [Chitinophagales bacterium]